LTHYDLEHEGEGYAVDIVEESHQDISGRVLTARVGSRSFRIAIRLPVSGNVLQAEVDGRPVSVAVESETRFSIALNIDGESVTFVKARRATGAALKKEEGESGALHPGSVVGSDPTEGRRLLRSPLPGRVVSIKVAAGEQVHPGSPLLVVVAMKMESTIASDRDGSVVEVLVKAGDAIRRGQPLVRF
jgi:acetyl-CoA/propionyl-CoA carboxylase, biotin carboxylase, biotin carboxyl carrier protein